jgi:hypothetical protein
MVENVAEVTQEAPVVEVPPVTEAEAATRGPEAKKASPAQDLRDIQYLLLNGIFPGNVAPAVVKAYQLLEDMSRKVEAESVSK